MDNISFYMKTFASWCILMNSHHLRKWNHRCAFSGNSCNSPSCGFVSSVCQVSGQSPRHLQHRRRKSIFHVADLTRTDVLGSFHRTSLRAAAGLLFYLRAIRLCRLALAPKWGQRERRELTNPVASGEENWTRANKATELCLIQGPDARFTVNGAIVSPRDLCVPSNREPLSGTNRGGGGVWDESGKPQVFFLAGCSHHSRLNQQCAGSGPGWESDTRWMQETEGRKTQQEGRWFESGWKGWHFQQLRHKKCLPLNQNQTPSE